MEPVAGEAARDAGARHSAVGVHHVPGKSRPGFKLAVRQTIARANQRGALSGDDRVAIAGARDADVVSWPGVWSDYAVFVLCRSSCRAGKNGAQRTKGVFV